MRCTTPMPVRLGSVLERARQSAAKMVVYVRNIVCSSQGYRENDSSQKDITRTGCDARVQFSISREGVWIVQNPVLEQLSCYSSMSHKLRSQQELTEADR